MWEAKSPWSSTGEPEEQWQRCRASARCGWDGCRGIQLLLCWGMLPPAVPPHQHGQAQLSPSKWINIPVPQGPLTRVAMGKLAGWMFCLMMRIYLYNDMFRSQIMSSDFSLPPLSPFSLLSRECWQVWLCASYHKNLTPPEEG